MKSSRFARLLVVFCFASAVVLTGLLVAGCSNDGPTPFPPVDKNLRKPTAQLAADAAKRHPFKADAPQGGIAVARAEVDYGFLRLINITNLSDQDWDNVEIWINRKYVVMVPKIIHNYQETINFQLFFDDSGFNFPIRGVRIEKLEMLRDGKIYQIPLHLAD